MLGKITEMPWYFTKAILKIYNAEKVLQERSAKKHKGVLEIDIWIPGTNVEEIPKYVSIDSTILHIYFFR